MKITGIKTYQMKGVQRNWTFVKVETDEGLYGWGEGTLESQEYAVEQAIHALTRRYLIGQDPTKIERHWQVMYRHGFWRGGPVLGSAVAALDHALWDITGKAYGVPVYKLLGGPVRDKVRVYTHANTPEQIKNSIEKLGFTAFKCTGWYAGQDIDEHEVVSEFRERIGRNRELVGPDVDILYDNHGMSRPTQAIQMLRAVEEYNLFFFEEPTQPDNLENLRFVRQNANVKTQIATGERLYHRWDYRFLLENQLADIIQPDISHCFGISELRRIAAAAETYYIRIAPHNPNGPICTAASVHVCAAAPNFAILESIQSPPWHDKVQKEPLKFTNSYIELPTKPGLGVDLDEDVIKSRPYVEGPYPGWYYVDGAPAEGIPGMGSGKSRNKRK
jgi:galactonate dehydratase